MATLRNYRKVGYLMSKRRLVSILAIVAALLLVPPTITSVVAAETSKEPITLTLFDKNTGDAFTNPVSLEIVKRTGISIEVQQPTGNPDE
jgi:spermidine/putrescine-binding protein